MLARMVERLLDDDNYPKAVKTAFVTVFFVGTFLLFDNLSKKLAQAEDLAHTCNTSFRGVLWKKILDGRVDYQLFMGQEFNWVETPDLRFYYAAPLTMNSIRTADHRVIREFSLPFCVEAGDSLIKKKGALIVLVKRGRTTRMFNYYSF